MACFSAAERSLGAVHWDHGMSCLWLGLDGERERETLDVNVLEVFVCIAPAPRGGGSALI
jgi:hypothetical protein